MAGNKKSNWNGDGKTAEERALETFADLMIERINEIKQDWKKPWFQPKNMNQPRNLSGRPYNGINTMMLLLYSEKRHFDLPVFVTYNQIAYDLNNRSKLTAEERNDPPAVDLTPEEGENPGFVHILKGEKSFPVFLTMPIPRDKETGKSIPFKDYKNLPPEEQNKYYVKHYTNVYNVYNLDQTNIREARPKLWEKICEKYDEMDKQKNPVEEGKMFKFDPLDRMISENKWICPIEPKVDLGAYYSISSNKIVVPPKKNFIDGESFYGTLLHEMTHSTGAKEYFGRFEKTTGDRNFDYGREELVAELSAAIISYRLGFTKGLKDESASYLKAWLTNIQKDSSFLRTTLDDVRRASTFIGQRIEEVRLDVREEKTASVDIDGDGQEDFSITDSLADKKQGEEEKQPELIAARGLDNENHGFRRGR